MSDISLDPDLMPGNCTSLARGPLWRIQREMQRQNTERCGWEEHNGYASEKDRGISLNPPTISQDLLSHVLLLLLLSRFSHV